MLTSKTIKKLQLEQQKLDEIIIKSNSITDIKDRNGFIRSKIALLVEIGELANELKTFKHWKKDKTINLPKAKEELIDCLHFYLSWVNHFEIDFVDHKFDKSTFETDYNELLLALFSETEKFSLNVPWKIIKTRILTKQEQMWEDSIKNLDSNDKNYANNLQNIKEAKKNSQKHFEEYDKSFLEKIEIEKNKATFYRWLTIFEEIAHKLGMNEKDIEDSYMMKNQINRERQQNKY
jgi:dimeric dUTPase (all-alpha-NTP-PPase superfamily)